MSNDFLIERIPESDWDSAHRQLGIIPLGIVPTLADTRLAFASCWKGIRAVSSRTTAGMVGCRVGRGAFIVLEGVDRSGKSTQCEKLVANLVKAGVS